MFPPTTMRLNRRSFLGLGLLGTLSLFDSLPRAVAADKQRAARAKNVLVIFEQGGMSQMDTWDPKPEAVAEHRSPFEPIATNVPGVRFTELLAKTARTRTS